MAEELTSDERRVLEALRAARGASGVPLPVLDLAEFDARMHAALGLGPTTRRETRKRFIRATVTFPGPLVRTNGTLTDLQESWAAQERYLVLKGASGSVVRHHREAIARYCEAAGIAWRPEAGIYERRSTAGRARRSEVAELPRNFLDLLHDVVHRVSYHRDPAINAMYQHRLRLNLRTAPRTPSEDSRLRLGDVDPERGTVTYRVSKIAGPESGVVYVPRVVYGVPASYLTAPTRKSVGNWQRAWRPRLLERTVRVAGADHGVMWVGHDGLPMDPERFRNTASQAAKAAWPDFYPYLCREVGIIMHVLEVYARANHFDLLENLEWSGHEKLENFRGYIRKAKQLLRDVGGRKVELRAILAQWDEI